MHEFRHALEEQRVVGLVDLDRLEQPEKGPEEGISRQDSLFARIGIQRLGSFFIF
jgi:hypothetical protein